MNAVNNFEQIQKLLTYEDEFEFYRIHIMKRKKDDNDDKVGIIRTFYIAKGELDKLKDDIISICENKNARAYIDLNVSSYKSVAIDMLKNLADIIDAGNFKDVRNVFNSTACNSKCNRDKKWLLDIDIEDELEPQDFVEQTIKLVNEVCMPVGDKVIDVIPSRSGFHIITTPFDAKALGKKGMIHKQCLTNLYIPSQK